METLIVKEQSNEVVKGNLKFRAFSKSRKDMFKYESYNKAKQRVETLSRIFKHTKFNIMVIEENN